MSGAQRGGFEGGRPPSGAQPDRTLVHLVRHGEVDNPAGLLYGRLPDYHLSDLGREMASRTADDLRTRDIVHLRCSPLERAQETMEPLADALGLPVVTDERVIEADNYLQGLKVTGRMLLRRPSSWWLFRNALAPGGASPTPRSGTGCGWRSRTPPRPLPAMRRSSSPTSSPSTPPATMPRVADSGTIPAGANAPWPA